MQISCAFCAWPAQPSAPSGAHGVPTVPIPAGSGSPPPAPALPAAPLAPPVAGPPLAPPVSVPPVPPVSVPPVLLPPPPVSPAAPARPPLPELCPPVPPELSLNWRSVFPHAKSNAGKLRTPSHLTPLRARILDKPSFIAKQHLRHAEHRSRIHNMLGFHEPRLESPPSVRIRSGSRARPQAAALDELQHSWRNK